MAQAEKDSFIFNADDLVPNRFVAFGQRCHAAFDTGIVKEAINPPELVPGLLHISLHLR